MTFQELINEVSALLGENPQYPIRWELTEYQRACNESLKKITGYFGDYISEVQLSLTDATDTYELPSDLSQVVRATYVEGSLALTQIALQDMPTDGKDGIPSTFSINRTSPVNPNLSSLIFYPSPNDDFEVIVTYNFIPTVDIASPDAVMPIGLPLEFPLIYLTASVLASKSTVEKNDKDQRNYYEMAMRSLSSLATQEINREYSNKRGYV